jgi:orotidine-5'-phosphate decarboxylase
MNVEAINVKMGSLQLANPTVLASGIHGSSLGKVPDALKLGAAPDADLVIVGRSIIEASNPREALMEIRPGLVR